MKLKVTQIKSLIRQKRTHGKTIASLGLRKIGSSRVHNDTPEIRGMINKVVHLVKVEEINE